MDDASDCILGLEEWICMRQFAWMDDENMLDDVCVVRMISVRMIKTQPMRSQHGDFGSIPGHPNPLIPMVQR